MNSFASSLPQIIPRPKFPVPKTSFLADNLAYAMLVNSRTKDGANRVVKLWKNEYYGTVLLFKKEKLAIYLTDSYSTGRGPIYYLFLNEPEEEKIPRALLFDRLNALLKQTKLPTLHEVVKDYWIFSDGELWNGRRLFRWKQKSEQSEKEILTSLFNLSP